MARQGYLRSYPSARAFALLVCGELSDSDPPMCFSVSAANVAKETAMMTDEGGPEIELPKIPMQMLFAAMLIDALHAAFKNAVETFDRVGMNLAAYIFVRFVTDALMACEMIAEREIMRYSNRVRLGVDDSERTVRALRGIVGKRLKYRDSWQGHA
jgi:hypothetical protein